MKTVYRATLFWFGLLVIAFANGAFREFVMIKSMGFDLRDAHAMSCLTGVFLWTLLLGFYWRRLGIKSFRESLWVGVGWFAATLVFETFILNRKLSWSEILHTYDVSVGEYWGLVLLWVGLMPVVAFSLVGLRHAINTWGATPDEQSLRLRGEELLQSPRLASTHALTVNVGPEKVWPWLVQMGQGRGGFYSYSWLENLLGCEIENASHILPKFQDLKQGDSISLHPKAPKLRVTVFEPNKTLAFEGWIFELRSLGGNKTRLISRIYTEQKPELGQFYNFIMNSTLFDLAHFVMSRKQLLSIKKLSERSALLTDSAS